MNDAIRIGKINYANVWPMFHHFPYNRFDEGELEIIEEVPTGLNRAMAAGEIDMGPISSFAYGVSYDRYAVYPELSVSAYGKVGSILLFHKRPLADALNGKVALTTASATSVNLLKIIAERFMKASPTYFNAAPHLTAMLAEADAALLIGDDAIRASFNPPPGVLATDLGELWQSFTGEWMTFAVWAIRGETVKRHPAAVFRIFHAFRDSKEQAHADPASMIRAAIERIGGTESYWRGYFGQLSHDFGPDQQRGLQLFYRYAWEMGLLERPVSLHIWQDDKSPLKVNE